MTKTLIINTGGTISMVHAIPEDPTSPLVPAKTWSEVTKNYAFFNELNADYISLSEIVDSSNMTPILWKEIAEIIEAQYHKYKGFVILHGTDTMAYTASALSFMLKNLQKPVILTGAQLPILKTRSDGVQNLLTAVAIVEESYRENATQSILPEVCVFFRDVLLRGNRARKVDSSNYAGFDAPNSEPLAIAGSEIKFYETHIRKCVTDQPFSIDTAMETNVFIFDLFPGFNPDILHAIISSPHAPKGIVLKTYGSGNAPTTANFMKLLERLREQGIVVVNVTQCERGGIEEGVYETNHLMSKMNIVGGSDMTPEAAITKLMYVLARYSKFEDIERVMEMDMNGELSE